MEERIDVYDFATCTNAITKRCHMWHQDQALLENWLVEGEVTDFEQEHGSCPESHQTCMGNVGAK